MIYLKREEAEFAKTKEQFDAAFLFLLEGMKEVVATKGRIRDKHTPIHHRMNPMTMLALSQAKMRRIETLMAEGSTWWKNQEDVDKVVEECVDAANYLLFISALCLLLLKEKD